jgi:hypothetical protein
MKYRLPLEEYIIANGGDEEDHGDPKCPPIKLDYCIGLDREYVDVEEGFKDDYESALTGESDYVLTDIHVEARCVTLYFTHKITNECMLVMCHELSEVAFKAEIEHDGETDKYLVDALIGKKIDSHGREHNEYLCRVIEQHGSEVRELAFRANPRNSDDVWADVTEKHQTSI